MIISIIEPVGGHGGMNYYDVGLGRALEKLSDKVTWYTCDETQETSQNNFIINKVFVSVFGERNKATRFARYLSGLIKTAYSIRQQNGKHCHVHFFHYGLLELITCLLLRATKIKIVATIHDIESFNKADINIIQRTIFRLCAHFIVHNDFSYEELWHQLAKIPIHRPISIIHHGNYIPFIQPKNRVDACSRLGLSPENRYILFFGQIKTVKGLDLLISAYAKIKQRHPDVKLIIAGKVWKTSFEEYQKQIDALGLCERDVIQHINYIPDDLVDDYYSVAELVALPYRRIYQSGVLLMAMSYGKTVLASDLPAMKEVINPDENGFLFKSEDEHDLATQLENALSAGPGNVGPRAKKLMEEHYSWDEIAQQHKSIFIKYS